jgi:hypothetical protein
MIWFLVAVGAATAAVLLGLLLGLLRHLRGLAASLKQLEEDVLPVLEEIRRSSEEAQARMVRLEERRTAMSGGSG